MRLMLDITGVTFLVTREAEPKKDDRGIQRNERETGRPMWTIEVCAQDERGGSILTLTLAGVKPEVRRGELVTPVQLEALPWSMNAKSGVSYRVSDLQTVVMGASSKLKAVG